MPSAKARAAKCRPHTFFHPPVLYMLAPVVFHSPPAVHASANRSASRDAHKDTPATSAAACAAASASAALAAATRAASAARSRAIVDLFFIFWHPPPRYFFISLPRRPLHSPHLQHSRHRLNPRRPRHPHRRQRRQHRHRQFIFFHFSPPQISYLIAP